MKIEEYVERVESGNVQTKNSKVEKIMELIMIFLWQDLHVQRKFYKGHDRNNLCLPFQKVVFLGNIVQFGRENKINICFVKINTLYLYDNVL